MTVFKTAPALSQADHDFFSEYGYIRVQEAVPRETCDTAAAAMWKFLEMEKDDPGTWYEVTDRHRKGGWTDLFHHPALWETRQSPGLHRAFAEIWATEKLWVSMDKCNMKSPEHPEHPEFDHEGFLHWDIGMDQWPPEFNVQGVLYLADTAENQGGFHCLPGVDHTPQSLDATVLEGGSNNSIDIKKHKPVAVPGKCGDLVIWDRRLPHGNGRNTAARPRIAQYITMVPAEGYGEKRQDRVANYVKGMGESAAEAGWEGDPAGSMSGPAGTFELTRLGRKLVGIDEWDDC